MVRPALFFEPEPVTRLPGPAVGPKGPKIGPKTKGRIYHVILPKVCPAGATWTNKIGEMKAKFKIRNEPAGPPL